MIYVFGADPFDGSPSSNSLHKQLKQAGFRVNEITVASSAKDLPGSCWCLVFGAAPFRELTGSDESITRVRGQLYHASVSEDVLVLPTFAPGYLYRNPELIDLWKDDLSLFAQLLKLEGVLK